MDAVRAWPGSVTLVWGGVPPVSIAVRAGAPAQKSRALQLLYGPTQPTLVVDAASAAIDLRALLLHALRSTAAVRGAGLPFCAPNIAPEGEGASDESFPMCSTCFRAVGEAPRAACAHRACAAHAHLECFHASHGRSVMGAPFMQQEQQQHMTPADDDDDDKDAEERFVYCARPGCAAYARLDVVCADCHAAHYCTLHCMNADAVDHLFYCSVIN